MLNLRADEPPSEQIISAVKIILNRVIGEIESRLLHLDPDLSRPGVPESWEILRQAGFLNDRELVDCALTRYSSIKLNQALQKNGRLALPEQLLARLVVGSHLESARLAQALLHDLAKNDGQRMPLNDIPSSAFQRLVWRIVGALQMLRGTEDMDVRHNAQNMISEQLRSKSSWQGAAELHCMIEHQYGVELADPQQVGLALFTAHLAKTCGLRQSHIMDLLSGSSILPIAILLHKTGVEQQAAIETIFALRGFEIKPAQVQHVQISYADLQSTNVELVLFQWSNERADWFAKNSGQS